MIDFDAVNQGFSREAEFYDADDEKNPVNRWARSLVRKTATRYIPSGGSILEINAGTGADAFWLVEHGYRVHATDIADGMLAAIGRKIELSKHGDRFTVQKLSLTNLEETDHAPFDGVFSNFGGLNCIPDLSVVVQGMKKVLKPGGWLVWVFMPPVCPWELFQLFRGRARVAARRLKRGGAQANVRGVPIMTYYFTAKQVSKALGQDFEIASLQSLSLLCPPMSMLGFINKFPRLTRSLMRLDEKAGKFPLLNQCGDLLVIAAHYLPKP